MTDKEKAIVMAYTGVVMLKGDKIHIFYKYVEKIMGRPILTHEMAQLATKIKEKSKDDFMALCKGSANECNLYNEKNNKLEKAKEIIKKNFRYGDCGLFKSRNLLGDPMHNIYNTDGLKIDICFCYSYFEVFGLTDEEFEELEDYYNKLDFEREDKE